MTSPVGTFILDDSIRIALQRRAFQAAPEEVCGFILKDGTVKEIRNIHHNPHKHFAMCPVQLREVDPKDVVALWHSHPGGSPFPSAMDQKNMADLGSTYGDWAYFIVTKDDVRQYNTGVDWNSFT